MMAEEEKGTVSFIKNNPFKVVGGILTILSMLVSGAWAAESRYNQMPQIHQLEQTMSYQRSQSLEDQILVLEMKKSGADQKSIDNALLERYKSRLSNIRSIQGR